MLKYLTLVENPREMPSCDNVAGQPVLAQTASPCGPLCWTLPTQISDSHPTRLLIPTNHSGPDVKVISSLPLSLPFYRWTNRGLERLVHLTKPPQLQRARQRFEPGFLTSKSMLLMAIHNFISSFRKYLFYACSVLGIILLPPPLFLFYPQICLNLPSGRID